MIDTAKPIRKNPKVDGKNLQEVDETIQKLRLYGVSGPGYRLAPPFRRQVFRVKPRSGIDR